MLEVLSAICRLQPHYSPDNTPEMKERGELIRTQLVAKVRDEAEDLISHLGEFGDDFGLGASDGIGRKTEAPWVRFFSERMSPTPRDGFYSVIHFSADGSAFWITVGCGSTIWSGGDLRSVSDEELDRRTAWGRQQLDQQLGGLAPLIDQIDLGAKAKLPRTFEKATVAAKRFEPNTATLEEVRAALVASAKMLRTIYAAQRAGSHLSPAEILNAEVDALSRPEVAGRSGQGFRMSAVERRAIELRGMGLALEWLKDQGYSVTDRSANSPFDILATKDGQTLKVEVKGMTSTGGREVMMTKNEVELHKAEQGSTALIVVSGIELDASGDQPKGRGGQVNAMIGWDIGSCNLTPLAYKVALPE